MAGAVPLRAILYYGCTSYYGTLASLWMWEREGMPAPALETMPVSHRAAMAAARLRKARGAG
eukprot:scaffold86490_cov22-Phaeocystis_antarctica.AAC.1